MARHIIVIRLFRFRIGRTSMPFLDFDKGVWVRVFPFVDINWTVQVRICPCMQFHGCSTNRNTWYHCPINVMYVFLVYCNTVRYVYFFTVFLRNIGMICCWRSCRISLKRCSCYFAVAIYILLVLYAIFNKNARAVYNIPDFHIRSPTNKTCTLNTAILGVCSESLTSTLFCTTATFSMIYFVFFLLVCMHIRHDIYPVTELFWC